MVNEFTLRNIAKFNFFELFLARFCLATLHKADKVGVENPSGFSVKTLSCSPIVEKHKNVCKNDWIRIESIRQVIQKALLQVLLAKSSQNVRLLLRKYVRSFFGS